MDTNSHINCCQYCGTPFRRTHASKLYCSQTCRQYAYLVNKGYKEPVQNNLQKVEDIAQDMPVSVNPVNQPSIDGIKTSQPQIQVHMDRNSIKLFKSGFIEDLKKLIQARSKEALRYEEFIDELQSSKGFIDISPVKGLFEKIKSYIHTLIAFSHKRRIPAWHLIQLYEDIRMTSASSLVISLNLTGVYIDELDLLIEKLSKMVSSIQNPETKLCFYLSRDTKLELLVILNYIGKSILYQPFRFEKKKSEKSLASEDLDTVGKLSPKYQARFDKLTQKNTIE